MTKPTAIFDFPYQLRQSKKAKRMNIHLSPEKGVEVVYPLRASEKGAIRFLQQQQAWVMKHRHIWERKITPLHLPDHVALTAVDEIWPIQYETAWVAMPKKARLLPRPDGTLVYLGQKDVVTICRLLKRWCLTKAKHYLAQRIKVLSRATGLPYQSVIFRTQKTRWGSCSETNVISLNTSLIFLVQPVVDYVIIHELAHTVHFNHSPAFWRLVERYVPHYERHRKMLRMKHDFIPDWFLQTRSS